MFDNPISVFSQVISVLLGFLSTYIIFDFMSKLGRTLYYKKYIYILAYIAFTLVLFGINIYGNSLINIIASLGGTIIIGHFLYNNNKIHILYYSIFILFLCCFQIVISILLQLVYKVFNINFANLDFYVITGSIVTQFANLSVSRLFIIWFKNRKIEKITPVQYLIFLILPFFSIFYIMTLIIYVQIYASMEEIILLIVNLIFIVVLNLYITNIFESISKNNILKNEIALYEQKSKMQYEYYNNLEKKYKNSRKVIHDMKNHLQSIEQLYNLKENHIASEYAKDMYEMLEELGQKYYTNNKVLNIIVNDQVQKAELLDIKLKCQIGDINLDFIKDIDLTTIFANLFDNAREACTEVKDDKLINFKVDKFNEFIVINLSNTINEIPKENKNGIMSKKKNHEGIGLVNVKKALEKYEGNMRIYYDQKLFKVNIVIPIV